MSDILDQRLLNLKEIINMGVEPFPYKYEVTHKAKDILEKYGNIAIGEKVAEVIVSIAGRIITSREHGKSAFANIKDMTSKIQIYIKQDEVGEKNYDLFKKFDIGDFVGIKGTIFKTRTGELTVKVLELTFLSKALMPLPEKWHGLKDVEIRYRQRYLDLIANPEVANTFITRSKLIAEIRKFLNEKEFMEVETPMMQPIPGGAAARPFVTHHNALDIDLYLRVAPELYLKRLIIGGFEKVYEINRNFRNEGISIRHNPEFTMLEVYQSYADYEDMMKLTEELFANLCQVLCGSFKIKYQEYELDFTPPWKKLTVYGVIKEYLDLDIENKSVQEIRQVATNLNLGVKNESTKGELVDLIFEKCVQHKLIQPTFIMDFPFETAPLAKRKRGNPELVERFEPYICGLEIGNSFSELNNPVEQRERFVEQAKMLENGYEEAQKMDEDFLKALEYGMPPAGGLGLGIDRIAMIFTNSKSIRDVLLFPTLRPE
ncbi:MAG: lysine--tRNA ligase [Candidatus Firestonebacteria bacterium]